MFMKSLFLLLFSLLLTACGGGGDDSGADGDSTVYPLITENLISGKIIFYDEGTNELSIPADTWIRFLPTSYYDNENFTGVNCKVSDDGQIGNECYIHENETEVRNLFNESSETFEVVVYHEQTGDQHWNASENPTYGRQVEVANGIWENIAIFPNAITFPTNASAAPVWTQESYDTGVTVELNNESQTIQNLASISSDINEDIIDYTIEDITVPLTAEKSAWLSSIIIENNNLAVTNLLLNGVTANGDITVTIKASDGFKSNNANITFSF